jgi:hypothetical protein
MPTRYLLTNAEFVDALRDFLGLDPIPSMKYRIRETASERQFHPHGPGLQEHQWDSALDEEEYHEVLYVDGLPRDFAYCFVLNVENKANRRWSLTSTTVSWVFRSATKKET